MKKILILLEAEGAKSHMEYILETYAGMTKENYHDVKEIIQAPIAMREDIRTSKIRDINYTTFIPTVENGTFLAEVIKDGELPSLDGFYGTKLKGGAEAILMGEYVPIYAQWSFGKGTVGSFMCDLNGTWSEDFLNSDIGQMIINAIINEIMHHGTD